MDYASTAYNKLQKNLVYYTSYYSLLSISTFSFFHLMRCNNCITVRIYRYDIIIYGNVPIFPFPKNNTAAILNFLSTPMHNIICG